MIVITIVRLRREGDCRIRDNTDSSIDNKKVQSHSVYSM